MGAPRGAVALPPTDIPELIILLYMGRGRTLQLDVVSTKGSSFGAERAEPAYGLDSIPAFWHVSPVKSRFPLSLLSR